MMWEYLWARAVITSSVERMVALHGEACVMSHIGAKLRFAFKAKWVAPWLRIWNARIHMLLVKPSQAPEMPEYEPCSPCLNCQPNLLMFPGLQLGAWNTRILEPSSSRRTENLNHCPVSVLQPNCRPVPGITFQLVFQHDCWCLTEGRETTLVLSASKNLGDSILEPWVVRLEEQRKSNIIWLIFSLKSLLWL